MWGLSYGGISSLKVAAENPPHLKAIIPIQGSANIYADYIAPGGCRSALGSYGAWGSFMLAMNMNLMPPTNTDREGRWYREDVILCESVQRGLRSGAIEHGQLLLSRERGIQHFQKLVYRFLC
jgi:predicted acyl esterase